MLTRKELGDKLSDVESPYCVYVPGIAGIPVSEKYEVSIAVKKIGNQRGLKQFSKKYNIFH